MTKRTYMEDLVGLCFDEFRMSKHALTFLFSGMRDDTYFAYRVGLDWNISFDPNEDVTHKADDVPELQKIWTYVEKNLEDFTLRDDNLSCIFHFKDSDPIVVWKDQNQPGELLVIHSETNEDWWVI